MTTYATLTADITDYMVRNDLSGEVDTFLDLTEDKIRRSLKIMEMRRSITQEAVRSSALDGIVFDVNDKFIQPISLSAVDTSDNAISTYHYVPIAAFEEALANRSLERVFAINGYPTTVPAYEYNGVQWLFKSSAPGKISDSKTFTFALLIKPKGIGGGVASRIVTFGSGGTVILEVQLNTSGNFQVIGRNASNTIILNYVSSTALTNDSWNEVLFATDMTSGGQCYINNSLDTGNYSVFTDDEIDFSSAANFFLGATNSDYDIAHYSLSTVKLDLTPERVRRRFFDSNKAPVPGGKQGQRAYGSEAQIWIPSGNKNYGTEPGIEPNMPLRQVDTFGDFPVISDQVELVVNPAVDADTRLKLNYYEAFPRLDGSNITTHWLIANNYDLYLYGCIAEAYAYVKDHAKEDHWRQKQVGVFEAIKTADKEKISGRGPHVRRNPGRTKP